MSKFAKTFGAESDTAPKDHVLSAGVDPGLKPDTLNEPLPPGSTFATVVRFAVLPVPTQEENSGRVDVDELLLIKQEVGNENPVGATKLTVTLLIPKTASGNL